MIIIAFFLNSFVALGQQHFYSLQKSKELALKNNVAVKNSDLSLLSSKENKLAANSAFLPSLSGIGLILYDFNNFIGPTPNIAPKGINNIFLAGATAMQPIYEGGKIRTNSKIAALQVSVSETRRRQSIDSVLLETEQKYWQLYSINEQYKALLYNEKYLDTLYKQQQDNLKAGLIARNDLLKVRVQKNQVALTKLKTANQYRTALLDFCRFIGTDYDSLMILSDTAYVITNPANLFVMPEVVLKNTDNYKLLEKNVSAEALQTRLKRASYLPSVAVGFSGSQAGVISKGLGSNFTPVAFGTVTIPISSWLWGDGRHVLKQQKYAEEVAQNNLADGSSQLQLNILKSWYDLTEGYQRVLLSRDNLAASAENLKANRDSYRSGLNDLTDLLNAQSDYQHVQGQLAEANSNYLILLSDYKFVIGRYGQE